jgi:hypothetical protein
MREGENRMLHQVHISGCERKPEIHEMMNSFQINWQGHSERSGKTRRRRLRENRFPRLSV